MPIRSGGIPRLSNLLPLPWQRDVRRISVNYHLGPLRARLQCPLELLQPHVSLPLMSNLGETSSLSTNPNQNHLQLTFQNKVDSAEDSREDGEHLHSGDIDTVILIRCFGGAAIMDFHRLCLILADILLAPFSTYISFSLLPLSYPCMIQLTPPAPKF